MGFDRKCQSQDVEIDERDRTSNISGTPTLSNGDTYLTGIEAYEHLLDLLSVPSSRGSVSAKKSAPPLFVAPANNTEEEEDEDEGGEGVIREEDMHKLTR